MVKLEEVPDEEYEKQQNGPQEDEDDWDTDDGNSTNRIAFFIRPAFSNIESPQTPKSPT